MSQRSNNITSWSDHLNNKYGNVGTHTRLAYEEGFEQFKIGFLIKEARKKQQLTQEDLALKTGTTKKLIAELERNSAEVALSTLMHIVRHGLGGDVSIELKL